MACDWDLNKTAMFLLESATTKTAYQQSEVKDRSAIKECVFQENEAYYSTGYSTVTAASQSSLNALSLSISLSQF